jgi:dimethylamine monooxygenase subunit A
MSLPELELPPPLDGRPHRVSMGLRPLVKGQWLLTDRRRDDELRLKQALLAAHHDEVVAALPGSEPGQREVLDLVLAAVTAGPEPLVEVSGGQARDRATGIEVPLDLPAPIDAAARLVQEDLCLMERDAEGIWRLTAASVCFPSRWRLRDKIGRSMAAIHDPVAGYERIRVAADHGLDRLAVERPVVRFNWTLLDDPTLFQPRDELRKTSAPPSRPVLEGVHLRVERQTLRALPGTAGVLFTIRTRVDPLWTLTVDERARLRATLLTVEPDGVAYRGWQALLPEVIEALEAVPDKASEDLADPPVLDRPNG